MSDLRDLLLRLTQSNASDLHVAAGTVPSFRLNGDIVPMSLPPLTSDEVQALIFLQMTEEQQTVLQRDGEIDFSFGMPNAGRFRCNVYRHRGTWAGIFRKMPVEIPSLTELGLPEIVRTLALKDGGLVLVTGPTSSGKSMTLAAMIETINSTCARNIITIEDPIEFLFKNKKCIIKQREIGSDTESYRTALKHIYRQDPDVIMIGEIRDPETIATAIACAGTGRLVLGTLNTMDAASSVNSMIESFPAAQQSLIQTQVAGCLEGVISQQLCAKSDGAGRALAVEVLVSTPSIRNLIRTGKSLQVQNDMETGKRFGMQTINQSLQELVVKGAVKLEAAMRHTRSPEALLQRIGVPK